MTVAHSRELLLRDEFSMILCEEQIGDGSYREILQQIGGFAARTPVVVFSRIADWDRYLEAMRAGAFDYLPDPCPAGEVESVVSRALRVVPLFP
jgi:DNA-binding NtrC family response regulator